MKTITITADASGNINVRFEYSQEEQLKTITPLEFKRISRRLDVAYREQKRNNRLESYAPVQPQ